MLIHVIRNDNQYDYVKDFMLDSLIATKAIIKFERKTGWVTVRTDPVRKCTRRPPVATVLAAKTALFGGLPPLRRQKEKSS